MGGSPEQLFTNPETEKPRSNATPTSSQAPRRPLASWARPGRVPHCLPQAGPGTPGKAPSSPKMLLPSGCAAHPSPPAPRPSLCVNELTRGLAFPPTEVEGREEGGRGAQVRPPRWPHLPSTVPTPGRRQAWGSAYRTPPNPQAPKAPSSLGVSPEYLSRLGDRPWPAFPALIAICSDPLPLSRAPFLFSQVP